MSRLLGVFMLALPVVVGAVVGTLVGEGVESICVAATVGSASAILGACAIAFVDEAVKP